MMYVNRAKERGKKNTSLISSVTIYILHIQYVHILCKHIKGEKNFLACHIFLMWKWKLSVEVVGWGCPSSENK